jgi:hypothetical protein
MTSRSWYLRIITRSAVHAMVDLRQESRAERFGAPRRRGAVLAIGFCAFLALPTAAHGAQTGSEGAVSPRYQVVSCDTTAGLQRAGNPAASAGARLAGYPRIPAFSLGLAPRDTRSALFRYQSREAISNNQKIVSFPFFGERASDASNICIGTSGLISRGVVGRISPGEARFLLQLAAAFAAAYVLFLGVWFWGTRGRRSRVGSAVRS